MWGDEGGIFQAGTHLHGGFHRLEPGRRSKIRSVTNDYEAVELSRAQLMPAAAERRRAGPHFVQPARVGDRPGMLDFRGPHGSQALLDLLWWFRSSNCTIDTIVPRQQHAFFQPAMIR